jgi:hypothetical protein
VHSEGQSITGPVIIEEVWSLYDEIKITDEFPFSDSQL